MKHKAQCTTT